MKINKILNFCLVTATLLFIIYLSVWVRLSTINTPSVLDYDPFWFYRHAKEILENNLKVPKWDYLSFYPPGRPFEAFQGWPYAIIFIFKILQLISPTITFVKAAIVSPLVMVALIPIPAFFLGKILTKTNIGGLATAIFATLSTSFISVSMAGYCDSDAPVVFYFFLSLLSVFLALQKPVFPLYKSIPFYLFASIANLLFIWNWGGGWLTLILFSTFLPGVVLFRFLQRVVQEQKFSITLGIVSEFKLIFVPFLIILALSNIIAKFVGFHTILDSLLGGLAFTGIAGEPLIVNISVAELQPINPFSREGFLTIAARVGVLPMILTLFGIPILAIYKIFRKEKIEFIEIFLFLFAVSMFYLISRGVRFSLLFSVATATSGGYVIGSLWKYLGKRRDVITAAIFGVIGVLLLSFLSDAIQMGLQGGGMMISGNWYEMLNWLKEHADKDALISTWWDPGHIIAGYTGLKVHADGAHCGPQNCIPYNHNIRISDMGKIMSTSEEKEAIDILLKYKNLTREQCMQAKEWFKETMPEDACKPVTEIYLIASSDLIGKYFWMSCFGSFDWKTWKETGGKKWNCDGRNFIQLPFSSQDAEGFKYGGGVITLTEKNGRIYGIINLPQQGIRNEVIREIVFYQNGVLRRVDHSGEKNVRDGLLWVDPSFGVVIFMDPKVRDSLFTTLFFFDGDSSQAFSTGKKIEHFQLVLKNPEIRLYKLNLTSF